MLDGFRSLRLWCGHGNDRPHEIPNIASIERDRHSRRPMAYACAYHTRAGLFVRSRKAVRWESAL
jgi:hypothetical protein